MNRSESGQSLIECLFLIPLYGTLLLGFYVLGNVFVIHHQLLSAVRQGAFLYSSGRLSADETRAMMQNFLAEGSPSMTVPDKWIYIGHCRTSSQSRLFKLDEVKITFYPSPFLQRLNLKTMEESCIIKHAPAYWQTEIPGANLGPPVPW